MFGLLKSANPQYCRSAINPQLHSFGIILSVGEALKITKTKEFQSLDKKQDPQSLEIKEHQYLHLHLILTEFLFSSPHYINNRKHLLQGLGDAVLISSLTNIFKNNIQSSVFVTYLIQYYQDQFYKQL